PPASPAISSLSLHDALPISLARGPRRNDRALARRRSHLAGPSQQRCREFGGWRGALRYPLLGRGPSGDHHAHHRRRALGKDLFTDRKSTRLNSSHGSISYAV